MNQDTKKTLSELFVALAQIEQGKKNLKNRKAQIVTEEEIKQKIAKAKNSTNYSDSLEKAFLLQEKDSLPPSLLNKMLESMEGTALSLLSNLGTEDIPPEYTQRMIEKVKKREPLDVDDFKNDIFELLDSESIKGIEEISAEIDHAHPSRELVKSFIIMTEAIKQTIADVQVALDNLSEYLDSVLQEETVEQNATQSKEKASAQSESPEPEEQTDSKKAEKDSIEEEIKAENKEVAEKVDKDLFSAGEKESVPMEVDTSLGDDLMAAQENAFAVSNLP